MQVGQIVLCVEVGIAALVLGAGWIGLRMGAGSAPAQRSLLKSALIGIGAMILLLAATHKLALKYGPLISREMLLLGFSFVVALIGGCAVGLARKLGNGSAMRGAALGTALPILLMMGGFYSRLGAVMDAAGALGVLQKREAYEPQKNKDCPENLKSLYIAFQQYAQDWDALPPAANWMDNEEWVSKVSRNEWLHCPAVSNRHDNQYGYAYNEQVAGLKLNGKRLKEMPDAGRTPLLYDSTNLTRSAHDRVTTLPQPGRHGGRNNVLYLDGHIEPVPAK